MKIDNSKGMTLIALVVSIIVLLIMSGISLNLVAGEEGILSKAKDAKIMTDLSNDLFDMESDIVSVRIAALGRKLKIFEVISGLVNNGTGKYNVSEMQGLHTSEIKLSNTRTNPTIAYSGDVFIDNYKRGNIQLAEIINKVDIPSLGYGDFSITVNDGNIDYADDVCTITSTEDHPVLWINQDSGIMAFAQTLKFVPYGILKDYKISQLDIFSIDSAFENVYDICNDKYAFNVTFDYIKDNEGMIRLEAFSYHFKENVEFIVGDKELKIGGMKVQRAGFLHAKTQEELLALRDSIIETYDEKIPVAAFSTSGYSFSADGAFFESYSTAEFECGDGGIMNCWLYEVPEETLNFDADTGRVYYTPFIIYQKWIEDEATGYGAYSPMLSIGTANYISYIKF